MNVPTAEDTDGPLLCLRAVEAGVPPAQGVHIARAVGGPEDDWSVMKIYFSLTVVLFRGLMVRGTVNSSYRTSKTQHSTFNILNPQKVTNTRLPRYHLVLRAFL